MDDNMLLRIYSRPETVLTIDEIAQLSPNISYESLKDRLSYFTKTGKIKRLHQGIYAKLDYNPLELANKVYKPAYISLETVLFKAGVVFQTYLTIFLVSYLTRSVSIGEIELQFRKIKNQVLTNLQGIEQKTGYFMATTERAFLDAIYIYKDYHFDNLEPIDWEKVDSLKGIYQSKAFEQRVEDYYKLYREDYGKY
jgi:predicted transcriptional regulator of viral defense system